MVAGIIAGLSGWAKGQQELDIEKKAEALRQRRMTIAERDAELREAQDRRDEARSKREEQRLTLREAEIKRNERAARLANRIKAQQLLQSNRPQPGQSYSPTTLDLVRSLTGTQKAPQGLLDTLRSGIVVDQKYPAGGPDIPPEMSTHYYPGPMNAAQAEIQAQRERAEEANTRAEAKLELDRKRFILEQKRLERNREKTLRDRRANELIRMANAHKILRRLPPKGQPYSDSKIAQVQMLWPKALNTLIRIRSSAGVKYFPGQPDAQQLATRRAREAQKENQKWQAQQQAMAYLQANYPGVNLITGEPLPISKDVIKRAERRSPGISSQLRRGKQEEFGVDAVNLKSPTSELRFFRPPLTAKEQTTRRKAIRKEIRELREDERKTVAHRLKISQEARAVRNTRRKIRTDAEKLQRTWKQHPDEAPARKQRYAYLQRTATAINAQTKRLRQLQPQPLEAPAQVELRLSVPKSIVGYGMISEKGGRLLKERVVLKAIGYGRPKAAVHKLKDDKLELGFDIVIQDVYHKSPHIKDRFLKAYKNKTLDWKPLIKGERTGKGISTKMAAIGKNIVTKVSKATKSLLDVKGRIGTHTFERLPKKQKALRQVLERAQIEAGDPSFRKFIKGRTVKSPAIIRQSPARETKEERQARLKKERQEEINRRRERYKRNN